MASLTADRLHDGAMILSDGRQLAWREGGDARGAPLLAFHGLPGSRLKFDVASAHARDLGIRLVSPDRWGYGDTDWRPEPSLRRYADDIGALADHLGMERFSVMGVSAGGPYAAAVAACHPHRTIATALVAPVGPILAEDDDEISAFHRFCFGSFARNRRLRDGAFAAFRTLLMASPRVGMAVAMARVPAVDRLVLGSEGVTERLSATFVEGLKNGARGPATDMLLFGRPWDVPLEHARAPARVWLGGQDRNVPLSAVRRLTRLLPNCTVSSRSEAGHLWVALNYDEVLRWVADMQKGAASTTP